MIRDRKRKSESEVSPAKRRHPFRGFTPSPSPPREENRDEADEEPDLIDYTSFAEISQSHSKLFADSRSADDLLEGECMDTE